MMTYTNTLPSAAAQPASVSAPARIQAVSAASAAALLGLVLLWGVGFSHIDAVHNAAHDTRHSSGFPCH
jgi:cobalt transporter subunit CbtB